MYKNFKYLSYFLFLPFWWLQRLIPRCKNIWLFGAWFGKRYSDNAKVLFEYVHTNHNEIKAIWITKNKIIYKDLLEQNIPVVYSNSFKGIYYSIIAGKVIFSSGKIDVNRLFINGAKTILTWHGAPMKKIGLDDIYSQNPKKNKLLSTFFPFIYEFNIDYIVSTADVFNNKLSSAFNIPQKRIILSGYPRNDPFFSDTTHTLISHWNKKFNDPFKIIYLPTFRDSNSNFNPFEHYDFNKARWIEYLTKSNSILVSKGHFVDNKIGNNSNHERIIHLSDSEITDLNPLLKHMDLLITDYSGVYFDFLLLKKPIILAPFDLKEYLSKSRELYFNYEKDIIGKKVKNWSEILQLLSNIKDFIPSDETIKEFNKYIDGNSCKRLTQTIKNIICKR